MKLDKNTADWCVKAQCVFCEEGLPIAPPPDGWASDQWTHKRSALTGAGTIRCQAGRLRAALVAND